jgi:hypothetical protein
LSSNKKPNYYFLDDDFLRQNHVNLFGTFFRQITPLIIRYTSTYDTIFTTLSPQALRFHTSGTSVPQHLQHPTVFSGGSCPGCFSQHSVPVTRHSGSSHSVFSRYAAYLQDQSKSPDLPSLCLPSTPKIKFPMIITPTIDSVFHVFSLRPHVITDKCLLGHPQSMTSSTVPFNLCHKSRCYLFS